MITDMRKLMTIVEAEAKRTPKASTAKPFAVEVVRYDGPKHVSGNIVDRTVIHAAGKDDLHAKIKAWMEEIGLDPEDEDDLSYVNWRVPVAEDTAAQAPAEPMDHVSRMERAKRLGFDLRLYHSTYASDDFAEFAPFSHFGTVAQANMRSGGPGSGGKRVIPVLVRLGKVKRLTDKDNGNWNAAKLRSFARQGYDGIVYLNRYEGIPYEEFEAVRAKGLDLDSLPDSRFRRSVPSAGDSYIVFDPANVRSINARFSERKRTSRNIMD